MATKKKPKEPLVRCNGTMTEAQYLAWIRSALRSKSLKWPPRNAALQAARRPYVGPNKLQKHEYQCAICLGWFKAKEVIVDHHPIAAGSILSIDDVGVFAGNLFCETDNLRVLDRVCHDIHTLAEKQGITFEQARTEKLIIEACKKNIAEQVAELASLGYNDCTNGEKRRKAYTEYFNKGETK